MRRSRVPGHACRYGIREHHGLHPRPAAASKARHRRVGHLRWGLFVRPRLLGLGSFSYYWGVTAEDDLTLLEGSRQSRRSTSVREGSRKTRRESSSSMLRNAALNMAANAPTSMASALR